MNASALATAQRQDHTGQLDALLERVMNRKFAVLTGAGMSTDSGIPDYRGEGAPRHQPMTLADFLHNPERRTRYWIGSHLGWRRFREAKPNPGHYALARLESAGRVNSVVTQNVDGLHHDAGSTRVIDIHGRLDRVRCLECGQSFHRDAIALQMQQHNPDFFSAVSEDQLRPDGDVDVALDIDFRPPRCDLCAGVLKPEVVFFGEFVPPAVFARAQAAIQGAEGLLVAGSSLVVNTGMRLVRLAHSLKIPIAIINRGPTKADALAEVRIEAGVTETLDALERALRESAR